MSPVGSQWMSEDEKETLRQARETEREKARGPVAAEGVASEAPKRVKKEPAITPAKLADMLRKAAAEGDEVRVKEALALGANPNTREKSRPRRSALELAISAKKGDAAALALLQVGGLCALADYGYSGQSDENKEFYRLAESWRGGAQEPTFKDEAAGNKIKNQTMYVFARMAERWSTLAKAHEKLGGESLESVAGTAARVGRWHIAKEAFEAGVALDLAWKLDGVRYASKSANPKTQDDRSAFLALLACPEAAQSMDSGSAEKYFRAAAAHDDAQLMEALLDAGLRPSEDWTVRIDKAWDYYVQNGRTGSHGEVRVSLLAFAASHDSAAVFEALKKTPPAVEAAKRRVETPLDLREITVGRLMELNELGVRVNGTDKEGFNVLHAWAVMDRSPRSGWATVAREMPELFAAKNKQGKTGAELMAAKLGLKEREEFQASLARIESREIRREIPRETTKSKAAAPKRSRL